MVRNLFCAITVALTLSSCAAWNKPTTVVAVYPNPPTIERPYLESDNLTSTMTLEEVIQAYRSSIIKLKDYAKQLEINLNVYKH